MQSKRSWQQRLVGMGRFTEGTSEVKRPGINAARSKIDGRGEGRPSRKCYGSERACKPGRWAGKTGRGKAVKGVRRREGRAEDASRVGGG